MKSLHPWTLSPEEAIQIQTDLRKRLILAWDGRPVSLVAGVDVSVRAETSVCALVVLTYPALEPVEAAVAEVPLTFPYIPGLLAFREGPAVLAAWEKLRSLPDLVLFDGQGIAHPRGLGIASQMGLWLERPTIGVAKSRLYGQHTEPGPRRGDRADLLDESGHVIGVVLRTKEKTKPLYISPGHLIDLPHAVSFVLHCCRGFRLPEPTRRAHQLAGKADISLSPPPYQQQLF
ncbi:MAG: deoxyribonuclease V [Anaerolineales bacterium]|nr:deoxyribonuclease V [Anaerolineales bacterium]